MNSTSLAALCSPPCALMCFDFLAGTFNCSQFRVNSAVSSARYGRSSIQIVYLALLVSDIARTLDVACDVTVMICSVVDHNPLLWPWLRSVAPLVYGGKVCHASLSPSLSKSLIGKCCCVRLGFLVSLVVPCTPRLVSLSLYIFYDCLLA